MNIEDRMSDALECSDLDESLYRFAVDCRNSGMSKDHLYRLFDRYRAFHKEDHDSTKYDAILDTMDYISGFCQNDRKLF